jgi:predicted ester cyclase
VQRLFNDVWNGRRLDLVEELYAPDFVVDYRPYAPLGRGRSAVRQMVERAWTTFPDYHEEMLAAVVEGDMAAVHLRISGTQSGAWGPIPPTGQRLEFEEILLLTFDPQGRVLHQRGIVDNLTGLRQAGTIPTIVTPPNPANAELGTTGTGRQR